jgi:hypothetical protein
MLETQVHTTRVQIPAVNETDADTEEIITFCPGCKAFQTLWLHRGKLVLTRKFFQRDNRVFHDCGATRPCRLYRTTHSASDGIQE